MENSKETRAQNLEPVETKEREPSRSQEDEKQELDNSERIIANEEQNKDPTTMTFETTKERSNDGETCDQIQNQDQGEAQLIEKQDEENQEEDLQINLEEAQSSNADIDSEDETNSTLEEIIVTMDEIEE